MTNGLDIVGYFVVNGHEAYCIEHDKATPWVNSSTSEPYETDNDLLRKVLYYGYGGVDYITGHDWIETSLAASSANGHTQGTRNYIDDYVDLESPTERFHVWIVDTNDGLTQKLAYWTIDEEVRQGNLQINKSSKNPEITDGLSCYSLEGAFLSLIQANSNYYR